MPGEGVAEVRATAAPWGMPATPADPPSIEVLRYAAFTDHGRGGNPAGVVLDAGGLTDAQMLGVAADVGYSETAFVTGGDTPEDLSVRYFSPRAEVPFCGHATVATAVALADRLGPGRLLMSTPAGTVPVRTNDGPDGITATLTSPPATTRPAGPATAARALEALHWQPAELDPTYPVHVASAGARHLVVAARSAARLADFDYDYPALQRLMDEEGWTTVHAFWAESSTVFHVRNAFPPGGVVEDPATGAAAAAFGGYLRSLALVTPPTRLTILQGAGMGRPSRLLVDLDADVDTVDVTGTATRMDR
jgi:PhzF family phenazine biosynthesis protein